MKCVPVHHGIPAVLHLDEPWLHRHGENGTLTLIAFMMSCNCDCSVVLPCGAMGWSAVCD